MSNFLIAALLINTSSDRSLGDAHNRKQIATVLFKTRLRQNDVFCKMKNKRTTIHFRIPTGNYVFLIKDIYIHKFDY